MSRSVVQTPNAPAAIGPYSQAITHQNLVFVSGQIPLHPATGQIVPGGIAEQTTRVLENLKAVLQAANSGLPFVLKTTIYLQDLSQFASVNDIYAQYFPENPPARATVQVSRLPKDVLVEIDCIATVAS